MDQGLTEAVEEAGWTKGLTEAVEEAGRIREGNRKKKDHSRDEGNEIE